ncbi:transcription elongation factor GreB [Flavobacteriaceae bacterium MAR_2010_188]|nr:transcription elongation factor GreB [Flavobacteriaceae bacterium MAR_2010_188]
MSRGFVKEDDQEETPIIPPRAALPDNATNYVTPKGLEMLLKERNGLEKEKSNLATNDEQQRRRDLAVIDGKMNLLNERISSARILKPEEQPQDEIRFAATVKLKINNNIQKFQIVGVDEADIKLGKIAFVAPIATAIIGKKIGEKINFVLGNETRILEILEISYL